MKAFSEFSTFKEADFLSLCAAIFREHLADDIGLSAYAVPVGEITNVTSSSVEFLQYGSLRFNYNIMLFTARPAGPVVADMQLFQAHYFKETPVASSQCLHLLEETILRSLAAVFDYVAKKDHRGDFRNVDYIFLSNLDFTIEGADYSTWISERLNPHYPHVDFQVATSTSIMNGLRTTPAGVARARYLEIVNASRPLLIVPSDKGIRLVPSEFLGLLRLDDVGKHTPLNVFARSTRRVREIDDAIEKFNAILAKTDSTENDFHQFFTENPLFLTGLSHKSIRSKVVLEREADGPLIPDFFMEPVSASLWDILDIKKAECESPHRTTRSAAVRRPCTRGCCPTPHLWPVLRHPRAQRSNPQEV